MYISLLIILIIILITIVYYLTRLNGGRSTKIEIVIIYNSSVRRHSMTVEGFQALMERNDCKPFTVRQILKAHHRKFTVYSCLVKTFTLSFPDGSVKEVDYYY